MLTDGIQGLQKLKKKGKGVTKLIMDEREKQVGEGSCWAQVRCLCCCSLRSACWALAAAPAHMNDSALSITTPTLLSTAAGPEAHREDICYP